MMQVTAAHGDVHERLQELRTREEALTRREQDVEGKEQIFAERGIEAQECLSTLEQALSSREASIAEREAMHAEAEKTFVERQALEAAANQVHQQHQPEAAANQVQQHQERLATVEQALSTREASIAEREAKHAEAERTFVEWQAREVAATPATEDIKRLEAENNRLADALEAQMRRAAQREDQEADSIPCAAPQDLSDLQRLQSEVQRLQSELQQRAKEAQLAHAETVEARRKEQELAAKAQRLEVALSRVRHDEQSQQETRHQAAKLGSRGVPELATHTLSGGIAGFLATALQDVELGQREAVTLVDLGIADLTGLKPVDNILQMLSALMAVRADARLAVFGVWMLCHLIYVFYLVYEHFLRR